MQPSTAQSAQSAESLDAVLGRFQAWSGSHKTKELTDGVRELSYEHALQSSRYRWQARDEAARTEVSDKNDFVPEPVENATIRVPLALTARDEISEDAAFADEAIAPDKVSLSNVAESRARSAAPAKKSASSPAFGNVLAGTVLTEAGSPVTTPGSLALVWPAAGKSGRQVSMSLRVGISEQALIKARAAEAGLSASAYLRQCALEVEQLRAQVQHTLAVIERDSRLALRAGENPTSGSNSRISGTPATAVL